MPAVPTRLSIRLSRWLVLTSYLVIGLSCERPRRREEPPTDPARAALIGRMKRLSSSFGVECEHCHVDRITFDRNGAGDVAELMMEHTDFAGPDWLERDTPRADASECTDCHVAGGQLHELTDEGRLTSAMVDLPSLLREVPSEEGR